MAHPLIGPSEKAKFTEIIEKININARAPVRTNTQIGVKSRFLVTGSRMLARC